MKVNGKCRFSSDLKAVLFWVVIIGLGSAAFHATMRYKLQLADELPMLGLIVQASCWLLRPKFGTEPHLMGGMITTFVSGVIIVTERDGKYA